MIDLYFIRHGLSEGNINKLIYSEKRDCEVELAEEGREQSKNVVNQLNDFTMHRLDEYGIWYSPYTRTVQTKDIFRNEAEQKGYHFKFERMNVLLREREWGDLQELSNKKALSDYFFNFYHRPKDGESFADVYQRVALFHRYLLDSVNNDGVKKHVIISHGEFLKVYMMFLLNWSVDEFDKYKTPRNAQLYHLQCYDNQWSLSTFTKLLERTK